MANDPANIPLTPDNVVGMIQRILVELHAYMAQSADGVDANRVMTRLEEAAMWTQRLPYRGAPQEQAEQHEEARVN
jgi:hypothetical protein